MAQVTKPLDKLSLHAATNFLVSAGPRIAHHPTLRKAVVHSVENKMMSALKRSRADSRWNPGVNDDRTVAGLSLLHTVERAMVDDRLSKDTLRGVMKNVVQNLFLESGDENKRDAFKAEHGMYPPTFLVVSPGKACNLHCTGCYANSGADAEKLDWDVFDRIITEAEEQWGSRFIVISGGEPLAYHSKGKGILDAAEKHPNMFFMFFTNSLLITDEIADRMSHLGNISPAISVEGWRERTDTRRGNGVFDKILVSMERLRHAKVPFGISLTGTHENCEEILSDAFLDYFFKEQGVLYGWLFHYMPIGRSYTLDLMPSPQQRIWMWRRSWEAIREKQIFLLDFWNHATLCDGCVSAARSDGGGYMYIDWNGAVSPCVFMPYTPVNINQLFANGGSLTDLLDEPFFKGVRDWQDSYRAKDGNILAPCPIRDHNEDLRRVIAKYEPDPSDEFARDALMDEGYARGMKEYDEAYGKLSRQIWNTYYARPADPKDGRIAGLPDLPMDPKEKVSNK